MNESTSRPAVAVPLPEDGFPLWLRVLLGLGLTYVFGRALAQFYALAPVSGTLVGKFSLKWGLGFAALVLASLGVLALAWTILLRPQRVAGLLQRLIPWRQALGKWRLPVVLALAAVPAALLLFTGLGDLLDGSFVRLVILLAFASLAAVLLTDDTLRQVQPADFLLALILVASVHIIAERLSQVTDYPFSLTWSEGNRFYDYSAVVDPGRYTLSEESSFRTTAWGRPILWGIIFLVPASPIWLHRLWDAFLWTGPYIALGLVLAYRARLAGRKKWFFALWVFVFLFQGPIYTPLVLSALLVVGFVRAGHWVASLLSTSVAGYYAAGSRWTWLPAPAGWAAILWLDEISVPGDEPWWRQVLRAVPAAAVAVVGLAGAALADARLFAPIDKSSNLAYAQPLLWYRMLPNVNYPEGILLGLLIATLPVVGLLVWLALTRLWPLNWIQALAYASAGLVFLGAGIVASAKIGGGNNLHNLDMFLITLALLAALALYHHRLPASGRWPAWVQAALLLACLLPAWNAVKLGQPLHLPPHQETSTALETLQKRVTRAQRRGPVLFIDQRQLLTFGYVQEVALVTDYEKKYMMDQAMAGNKTYFERFYQDLANRRFSMIVTEPLYENVQAIGNTLDESAGFNEENNAWVQWVAKPLLCYYAPVETLPGARTQLLVPREAPQGCP